MSLTGPKQVAAQLQGPPMDRVNEIVEEGVSITEHLFRTASERTPSAVRSLSRMRDQLAKTRPSHPALRRLNAFLRRPSVWLIGFVK